MSDFEQLGRDLREFAEARDWDQFHTPKNLSMALAGEVGELVSELQWIADEPDAEFDEELRSRLSDECADVFIYLVRFCQVAGIDLLSAANAKIEKNERRYPVALARGSAAKYTELGSTSDQ